VIPVTLLCYPVITDFRLNSTIALAWQHVDWQWCVWLVVERADVLVQKLLLVISDEKTD